MYCTPTENLVARKRHVCTNCGEFIEPGDAYARWGSVDDCWFTNKMHPECLQALNEDAGGYSWEYMAFSGERPRPQPSGAEQHGEMEQVNSRRPHDQAS